MYQAVKISENVSIGPGHPLCVIAGPCVIEPDENMLFTVCCGLQQICAELGLGFVFKTSYDKANRTSHKAYRGPGLDQSRSLLERLKKETGALLLLDVHSVSEVDSAAAVADILQIPAFLSRQTDLVSAVAAAGRVVNVKKGQFLAPDDMKNVVSKIEDRGNRR
ncbi:MAG: 3-deoxy-8-phosphooctulonate synthase, partial [Candidatus Wallbacteria bacterium]|nr:3-deoxy-8-phosphooctulonate synthase [Candidatus Wallbacteria bacterium]